MPNLLPNLKSRSTLLPLPLLALSVLIFFGDILLSKGTLFGSDFILQFHPWKKFLFEHFRANGTIPLWNPYTFSGVPFIANIQASMFYPLGILYYLLPPDSAYLYSTVLHCILGSWFMYLFMRNLGASPFGSALAAIIFTYNGYFIAHLYAGHLTFIQNYIWIPLAFMLQSKSFHGTHFLKWTVACGLVLGVQILGGFPQIAFYTIIALGAHALYQAVARTWNGRVQEGLKAIGGVLMIVSLGFSIAAVQVLPTAEFTQFSMRAGGLSYELATIDSLHPGDMFSFLIPELFGSVLNGTYWGNLDGWHFWETCGYVGVLPLCLLLSGSGGKTYGPSRSFFVWTAALTLLAALGRFNPLYPVLYRWLGFGYFRIPAQILFLYVFSISVVAGVNMDVDSWPRTRWRYIQWSAIGIFGAFYIVVPVLLHWKGPLVLFAISRWLGPPMMMPDLHKVYVSTLVAGEKAAVLFLVILTLYLLRRVHRIGSSLFAVLCCLILIADLFSFGRAFVKLDQSATPREKEELVSAFSRDPVNGRVMAEPSLFYPNDGLEYRFPSISGYDPMSLKRYTHFVQASQDEPLNNGAVHVSRIKNPGSSLLAQLNLRQVVSIDGVVKDIGGIPYLNLVEKAVVMEPDEMLSFMKSPEFLPGKMVALESGYKGTLPVPLLDGQFNADWNIVSYRNEDIKINVSANNACFLVLSEVFYPGWTAEVDGAPAPIIRGNYLLRTIRLERGDHFIHLKFVSLPFRIGAAVSLAALSLALFVLFRGFQRRSSFLDLSG